MTISRICKVAGIGGYKTNHSLRVMAATRLYQAGVDEQLIMKRTGHRSIEGVRVYKCASDEREEEVSAILQSRQLQPSQQQVTISPSAKRFKNTDCVFNVANCTNVSITIHK